MKKKAIGVIGGMGPLAATDFFRKIVVMTKAETDQDHIRIYIDNNAQVPDRNQGYYGMGEDPLPALVESAKKLEYCGADCITMSCNTAHYLADRLQKETKLPIISIIKTTASVCDKRFPGKTAGILGSRATIEIGLYGKELEAHNIKYIVPSDEDIDILMKNIFDVKAGKQKEDLTSFFGVIDNMKKAGADYFILGCTELPLVVEMLDAKDNFIDPTAELARAAIEFCGYELKE